MRRFLFWVDSIREYCNGLYTAQRCLPLALEFRWRFLVKSVGERDGSIFDGELVHSMPRVKRLSLHGRGERTRQKETRLVLWIRSPFFQPSQFNGKYVMVTMINGRLTSLLAINQL